MSSSSEGQQISEICRNNEAYRKSAIKAADCDHKDSLKVIEEFQEVYRKRMKLLNEASDKSPELSELKIRTLQDWVEDLTEQNSLLATTLEELEAEALVKANSLSHTTSDFSRTRNSFHDSLVSNRTVTELVVKARENELIIQNLRNDLASLLELIRRFRTYQKWDLKNLQFKALTYQDIFGCCPPPCSPSIHCDEDLDIPSNRDQSCLFVLGQHDDILGKPRRPATLQDFFDVEPASLNAP